MGLLKVFKRKKIGMLSKTEIVKLLDSGDLVIKPLLDFEKQIGEVSIDFRLGTDFLISSLTKYPYIDIDSEEKRKNMISSFFSKTRRQFGEQVLLYPNQTILASTLEYIKLPDDIFCNIYIRSSYARLGLNISTIIQSGYCGCVSLELTNPNNNIVQLTTGTRIIQATFNRLQEKTNYFNSKRKYMCQVRPILSAAQNDIELKKLSEIRVK